MITIPLRVHVRSGKRDELVETFKWSRQVAQDSEPGTLRFDFYDDPENDDAMYLYESYRDSEAFEEHKANESYQGFVSGTRPNSIESLDRLLFLTEEIGGATD